MSQRTLVLSVFLLTAWVYAPVRFQPVVYEEAGLIAQGQDPVGLPVLRPNRWLTVLSFQGDARVFGAALGGWHLTNLAVHLVNGLLVWSLAGTLGLPGWLAAGVFLLHPIQSEAVIYLNGRGDLLSTLGILLVLVSVLRDEWADGWRSLGLGVGLLVALLSKETGIVVLLLLQLCWQVRPWRLVPGEVLAFVVLVGAVAVAVPLAITFMADYWSWTWFLGQPTAAWSFLSLTAWPFGLSLDHDWTQLPVVMRVLLLVGWWAIPVQAVAWARLHQARAFALGWIWLALLPRLIVPVPDASLAEHQFYLAFVGVSLGLGALWVEAQRVLTLSDAARD